MKNQYKDRYIPFEYTRFPFFVGEGISLATTYKVSGGVKVYKFTSAPSLKASKFRSGQWLASVMASASRRISSTDFVKFAGYAEMFVDGKPVKRHKLGKPEYGTLSPDHFGMELCEPFALPESGKVEIKVVIIPNPICRPDGCTAAIMTKGRAAYTVKIN